MSRFQVRVRADYLLILRDRLACLLASTRRLGREPILNHDEMLKIGRAHVLTSDTKRTVPPRGNCPAYTKRPGGLADGRHRPVCSHRPRQVGRELPPNR